MKVVQIGANKGSDDLSNYLKKNYSQLDFGLFVEANSFHINDLKECYKDYKNVFIENIAIKISSHKEDKMTFFYHTKDAPLYAITSFDINHIYKHINMCPHLRGGEIKTFEVPCIFLDDLFDKYEIQDLDWLLIDAEGIESDLILNTDWSKYNIKKIEFENLHLGNKKEEIRTLFKTLGYVRTNALHEYDEAWIKKTEVNEMNVTLYAICKNEEKNIDKFIDNSKKFYDTVVVDTGSVDNTVQLLRDHGITVYEHPQREDEFDFSIARNQALSYVKTDWAFSLDFNETVDDLYLDGFDVIQSEFTCFKHLRFDDNGEGEPTQSNEVHVRFHRTENYKWANAVHEIPQFFATDNHSTESSVDTTIKITKKIHRTVHKELFYLSICEREYQKNPKNWNCLWFIFNHYWSVGSFDKVLTYGHQFLDITKPYFDQFRIHVFIKLSQVYFSSNELQKACNYAFHALSEAMNIGEPYLSEAFQYLNKIAIKLKNPNIIVFATAFNSDTLSSSERTQAIDKLFLTNLDDILSSAWLGHRGFAEWLVTYLQPKVVVDLGVDLGFSTFSFAMPRIGHVYGIDTFEGDDFTGKTDGSNYNYVLSKREKLFMNDNVTFIKGYFDDVAKTWDKKIDILHIDGSHHYEDVKRDFETWSKFLSDDGVILLHDTCVESLNGNEYGVKKFFDEIDLPKFTFRHSFGLGVVSKNKSLIDYIQNNLDR